MALETAKKAISMALETAKSNHNGTRRKTAITMALETTKSHLNGTGDGKEPSQ